MSRRQGYVPLGQPDFLDRSEDEVASAQWAHAKRPFPSKEIILGLALMLGGVFLVGAGLCSITGIWDNRTPGSATAFIALGTLAAIPGVYTSVVALQTARGVRGYNWDMIPQMSR